MSAVAEAVNVLNARLCAAVCIGEAFDLAGGESPPPWVNVYRDQIEAIRGAAEQLERLLSRGFA